MPLILLNAWIVLPASAANDPPPSPVMVCEVNFSGGATVLQDDPSMPIPYPHWEDKQANTPTGDPQMEAFPDGIPDKNMDEKGKIYFEPNHIKSYMYSYSVEQTPIVEATFKWFGGPPPVSQIQYWCKGEVVDTPNCSFTLPVQPLKDNVLYQKCNSPDKVVVVPKIQGYVTPNRLVKRSGIIDLKPIKIRWTVTDNVNPSLATKTYVSYSSHTIYVTWRPSLAERRETILNLACEMANNEMVATGDKGEAVFGKIWGGFTDLSVKRMGPAESFIASGERIYTFNEMCYYRDGFPTAEPILLIENGDGDCTSWAKFLSMTGAVHGLEVNTVRVLPKRVHQYKNAFGILQDEIANGFRAKYARGQGVLPAVDHFNFHMINTWGGLYEGVNSKEAMNIYDASYGKTFTNNLDWEDASVDGYLFAHPDSVTDLYSAEDITGVIECEYSTLP